MTEGNLLSLKWKLWVKLRGRGQDGWRKLKLRLSSSGAWPLGRLWGVSTHLPYADGDLSPLRNATVSRYHWRGERHTSRSTHRRKIIIHKGFLLPWHRHARREVGKRPFSSVPNFQLNLAPIWELRLDLGPSSVSALGLLVLDSKD